MNRFERYVAAKSQGLGILADSVGLTLAALTRALKSKRLAKQFLALHQIYFTGTSAPKKQARAVAGAERNGHSVELLVKIEQIVARVKQRKHHWALRIELCEMAGSDEQIIRHGNARVRELNGPTPPQHGLFKRDGSDNTSTLTLRGSRNDIADLMKTLNGNSPTELLDSLFSTVFSGGNARPKLGAMVRIPIDQSVKILERDGQTRFALSDGSILTGAELAQRAFDSHGWAVLVKEGEGPIDALPFARTGTKRQRIAVSIDTMMCAWPDCNQPVDNTQLHHVTAVSQGGKTVIRNLTCLCPFHNGWNDDDPTKPLHGRIEMRGGKPYWFPPRGGPPIMNQHPVMQLCNQ